MEFDTGAARSVMSEVLAKQLFPNLPMKETSVVLHTYSAETLPVCGELLTKVAYGNQVKEFSLLIMQGNGPTLLGRDWLAHLCLDWEQIVSNINVVRKEASGKLPILPKQHQEVFKEELGTASKLKASLSLREDVQPKFFRLRSVPFAIKEAVGKEIERLEKAGILEKVDHSEWAVPIVPVPKKDGKIRICGDYKVTINPYLKEDQHPLPTPEEIFATLAGGKKFTKLDLSRAYQQILLDDTAKKLITINTPLGMYRYTCLPFGVSSAPAIFKRTIWIISSLQEQMTQNTLAIWLQC